MEPGLLTLNSHSKRRTISRLKRLATSRHANTDEVTTSYVRDRIGCEATRKVGVFSGYHFCSTALHSQCILGWIVAATPRHRLKMAPPRWVKPLLMSCRAELESVPMVTNTIKKNKSCKRRIDGIPTERKRTFPFGDHKICLESGRF
jgi:hypothetical protein